MIDEEVFVVEKIFALGREPSTGIKGGSIKPQTPKYYFENTLFLPDQNPESR